VCATGFNGSSSCVCVFVCVSTVAILALTTQAVQLVRLRLLNLCRLASVACCWLKGGATNVTQTSYDLCVLELALRVSLLLSLNPSRCPCSSLWALVGLRSGFGMLLDGSAICRQLEGLTFASCLQFLPACLRRCGWHAKSCMRAFSAPFVAQPVSGTEALGEF
jgi:hypothetical protein